MAEYTDKQNTWSSKGRLFAQDANELAENDNYVDECIDEVFGVTPDYSGITETFTDEKNFAVIGEIPNLLHWNALAENDVYL